MPTIELTTKINSKIDIVFDLSRSIDLHKISTQNTKEEAVAGIKGGLINLNESVTWRAKHFGIYQTLTSKITSMQKPQFFIDEMEKGIFKSFKHQHLFSETANIIIMIDIFEYISPLGILGRIADSLFLKNYLRKFLIERNEIIKEYAESQKWKDILAKE
ncbi:cell division protein [Lacihabitans sp. LS3-19]|uniref:SRPBCC family protein n=1 Tax=Lacihabitans sp. LS3-19 TaxID=2487335 RepID=UPI0020CC243B|nr:SRPBCC family protein [Lacihabitans sp. LS3-19]MCP9770014.1 cell division protein [Lacihabitans sp. LS3-19]